MKLKRGITSFFNRNDGNTIPKFTFFEFKRVVFAVANSVSLHVTELTESEFTPNFHSAHLNNSNTSLTVVGHSSYPIFAFCKPFKQHECQLHFVNRTTIAIEMKYIFPYVTVATVEELNREPTKIDLDALDAVELEQIKYWKPQSIGEIVFNWWD